MSMSSLLPVVLSACLSVPVGDRAEIPDGDVPIDRGTVLDEAFADEVDDILLPVIESGGVNAGVALVKDGAVVLTAAYGWADLDQGTALTVDTPMAMASVSKTFIGVAAMQAVEDGRLTLDDPISDLLGYAVDNPKVDGETLTLRHFLTHHSGLEDSLEYALSYDVGDPTIALDAFVRGYLLPDGDYYRRGNWSGRAPNEGFSYSNVGAGVAAQALATTAGKDFADVVYDGILTPLGMVNSGYFLPDLPTEPATQYDGRLRPYEDYGYPTYPDGMMRSSPSDMARYLAMLSGGGSLDGVTVLTEASLQTLWTVDESLGTDEDGQAIVWARLGYMPDRPLMGHAGGDFGTIAVLGLDRSAGSGVVVMLNSESGDFELAFRSLEPLFEALDGVTVSGG